MMKALIALTLMIASASLYAGGLMSPMSERAPEPPAPANDFYQLGEQMQAAAEAGDPRAPELPKPDDLSKEGTPPQYPPNFVPPEVSDEQYDRCQAAYLIGAAVCAFGEEPIRLVCRYRCTGKTFWQACMKMCNNAPINPMRLQCRWEQAYNFGLCLGLKPGEVKPYLPPQPFPF
jgi:hypothetical protein